MKTNKKAGIVALAALVAVGSYFIAGTYAKYTSTVTGTDTASVAKWAWTIFGDTIESDANALASHTFDLFNTTNVYDSDCTSTESDVYTPGTLIAPGMCGSFDIEIINRSEVNATYAIALSETSNTEHIPIEYSLDKSTWKSASDFSDLNTNDTIAMRDGAVTTTVYWRWAYTGTSSDNYTSSQTDQTDTLLGFAANTSAPTVGVTANVTVTQAD